MVRCPLHPVLANKHVTPPPPPPLGVYDYGLSDTYTIGDGPASPLWLDGWLQWNEEMWGLTAERVCYCPQNKEVPKLEGVLYINNKGQVEMPPRNPYLPFIFTTSGTNRPERVYNQYLELMGYFSDDLKRRGIRGQIALPVGFLDARPFQWKGFITDMRYTFMQKLPLEKNQMANQIKNKINKSIKSGYSIVRSCDWDSIVECLETRGNDKGFSHHTDAAALSRCAELLGNDSFLGYIGYDSNGKPVAGGLRLMVKEGIVIAWSQGAITEHLKNGINQLIYDYVLNDVYNMGAKIFDWAGANIPPVALAKSAWGPSLVPYITIQEKNMRYAVRTILSVTKSLFKKAV
ncbi:hypothetical protein AGMMS49579_17890 [Spirochaetia bacterium]|nr:hypothetical protein AGMMS49579_17890 [Spirochaetia bacterium]